MTQVATGATAPQHLFPVTQSPPLTPGTEMALEAATTASPAGDVPATPPAAATATTMGLALTPSHNSPPPVIDQAMLQNFMLGLNLSKRPENTAKAFNLKTQEFFEHCDCVCAGEMNRHHLTHQKVHRFVFCQCFREQRRKVVRRKTAQQQERLTRPSATGS